MEIDPALQLAMLLSAFLFGTVMGLSWEALTATRILLGAYRPPETMRARYEKELPLIGRSVPFERKNPLQKAWRHTVVALGDGLFCLIFALGVILILYRYNNGVVRISVPVLTLLGLALFRLISTTLLAPIMAYLAYGFAAGMLYLGALLRLPLRVIAYLVGRFLVGPCKHLGQKVALRRARRTSAALCAAQLAFAERGLEGEGPVIVKKKGKKPYVKENTGKNHPRPMGDPYSDPDHFCGGRYHSGAEFDGDQPTAPAG